MYYLIPIILIINLVHGQDCRNSINQWNDMKKDLRSNSIVDTKINLATICPKNNVCCTNEMKEGIFHITHKTIMTRFFSQYVNMTSSLMDSNSKIVTTTTQNIKSTWQDLDTFFNRLYSHQYTTNRKIFEKLFDRLYYFIQEPNSEEDLHKTVDDFFNELRLGIIGLSEKSIGNKITENNLQCLSSNLIAKDKFLKVEKISKNLKHSYQNLKTVLNSNQEVVDILKHVQSADFFDNNCVLPVIELTHCNEICSVTPKIPCQDSCHDMLSGCFDQFEIFMTSQDRWLNLVRVNDNLKYDLADAIKNIEEVYRESREELIQNCNGKDRFFSRIRRAQYPNSWNNPKQFSSHQPSFDSTNGISASQELESLLSQNLVRIKGLKNIFNEIPNQICGTIRTSNDNQTCLKLSYTPLNALDNTEFLQDIQNHENSLNLLTNQESVSFDSILDKTSGFDDEAKIFQPRSYPLQNQQPWNMPRNSENNPPMSPQNQLQGPAPFQNQPYPQKPNRNSNIGRGYPPSGPSFGGETDYDDYNYEYNYSDYQNPLKKNNSSEFPPSNGPFIPPSNPGANQQRFPFPQQGPAQPPPPPPPMQPSHENFLNGPQSPKPPRVAQPPIPPAFMQPNKNPQLPKFGQNQPYSPAMPPPSQENGMGLDNSGYDDYYDYGDYFEEGKNNQSPSQYGRYPPNPGQSTPPTNQMNPNYSPAPVPMSPPTNSLFPESSSAIPFVDSTVSPLYPEASSTTTSTSTTTTSTTNSPLFYDPKDHMTPPLMPPPLDKNDETSTTTPEPVPSPPSSTTTTSTTSTTSTTTPRPTTTPTTTSTTTTTELPTTPEPITTTSTSTTTSTTSTTTTTARPFLQPPKLIKPNKIPDREITTTTTTTLAPTSPIITTPPPMHQPNPFSMGNENKNNFHPPSHQQNNNFNNLYPGPYNQGKQPGQGFFSNSNPNNGGYQPVVQPPQPPNSGPGNMGPGRKNNSLAPYDDYYDYSYGDYDYGGGQMPSRSNQPGRGANFANRGQQPPDDGLQSNMFLPPDNNQRLPNGMLPGPQQPFMPVQPPPSQPANTFPGPQSNMNQLNNINNMDKNLGYPPHGENQNYDSYDDDYYDNYESCDPKTDPNCDYDDYSYSEYENFGRNDLMKPEENSRLKYPEENYESITKAPSTISQFLPDPPPEIWIPESAEFNDPQRGPFSRRNDAYKRPAFATLFFNFIAFLLIKIVF